jgi:hypothetical protein
MSKLLLIAVWVLLLPSIYALTGTGVSASVTLDTVVPDLQLLSPAGGEEWYIGDSHDILWSGYDTHPAPLPVSLYYTLDGGLHWTTISPGTVNDGSESWLLPYTQTYSGKVKALFADSFGHIAQDISSNAFSITYAPPLEPGNIGISLLNSYDALISWDPVTQTIYNTPVTPDGYLIFVADYPGNEDDYAFFWYVTGATSFIHPNVARFDREKFYYVLAYKDFNGRVADYLAAALANDNRLSLAEMRGELEKLNGGAR